MIISQGISYCMQSVMRQIAQPLLMEIMILMSEYLHHNKWFSFLEPNCHNSNIQRVSIIKFENKLPQFKDIGRVSSIKWSWLSVKQSYFPALVEWLDRLYDVTLSFIYLYCVLLTYFLFFISTAQQPVGASPSCLIIKDQ